MQLLAQDVQYNLRDSSDLAMMNLPKSQREMELIQAEAGALHTQTERLKKELEDTMRTSDGSRIAHLGELAAGVFDLFEAVVVLLLSDGLYRI